MSRIIKISFIALAALIISLAYPLHVNASSDYESFINKARDHERKGQIQEALDFYMKAAKAEPGKAAPWAHASILYVYLKDPAMATKAAEKAIELEPDSKLAWTNKGATEVYLGNHRKAIMTLNRALARFPNDTGLMNNLAAAYIYTNRIKDAEKLLQSIIQTDPDNAKAHYNLACIYAVKGFKLTAMAHLSRAIEIDPAYKKLAPKDNDLSNLHKMKSFKELTR